MSAQRPAASSIVAGLGCGALALAQARVADTDALQITAGLRPVAACCADLDGDGAREVLIATRARGKDFTRSIQIWRRGPTGFALAETQPLTPDVVAWATGDVLAGGGDEIVLFNAGGAFAWRASGPPEQRLQRLCTADFLWQLADPEDVFLHAECVRDLDGDGALDLALPVPDGFQLVLQRRSPEAGAAWGATSRLRVPTEGDEDGVWVSASTSEGASVRGRRREGELSLSFSGGERESSDDLEGAATLLQVNEAVPSPHWSDWDGDGDLDLLAQTAQHLLVWLQEPRGAFGADPSLSLPLPVEADRKRRLDASYSSHVVDLDGDRKADCAVFAGDQRSDDVRTQGLFFVNSAGNAQHPLFGAEGRPRDVLVFAGFIANPTFTDVDLDGLPDLVLRAVRPDLIDQMRSAANKAIEAELYVYLNRKGTFPRQPDVAWRHAIPLERFSLSSEFVGDLTGDGVSELVVRDEPERLLVLYVRRGAQGAGWTVFDKPLWQLDVDEKAEIVRVPVAVRAKPELLVIEPTQVLYVRFR